VVERSVLDALESFAASIGVRWTSIAPLWSQALRVAIGERPELQAFGFWEGGALTVLGGSAPHVSMARTTLAVKDAATAKAAFLRAVMGEGIDPSETLAVGLQLGGPTPPASGALVNLPFGEWSTRLGAQR